MKYKSMTQKELAEKSGLTEACISQIINEKREPQFNTVVLIFEAMGLKLKAVKSKPETKLAKTKKIAAL